MSNIITVIISIFLLNFPAYSQSVDMLYIKNNLNLGGRLGVTCLQQICAIDTGGPGTLVPSSGEWLKLDKKSTEVINTAVGPLSCDNLEMKFFSFAGSPYPNHQVLRCDANLPIPDSPLVGVDIFEGKHFALQFSKSLFSWIHTDLKDGEALSRLQHFILIKLTIADKHVNSVFDTGAPISLVDESYYENNRSLFEDSIQIISGFKVVRLKSIIAINGIYLQDRHVMVVNLKTIFGPQTPIFFLGMNNISEFDWQIDLKNNKYKVFSITH